MWASVEEVDAVGFVSGVVVGAGMGLALEEAARG